MMVKQSYVTVLNVTKQMTSSCRLGFKIDKKWGREGGDDMQEGAAGWIQTQAAAVRTSILVNGGARSTGRP